MTNIVDTQHGTTVLAQAGRTGLDGKDAAFLGTHFNAQADRHLVDAIRDEGRHGVEATHATTRSVELAVEKTAAATALAVASGELRLSKDILKEACETRELVRAEANATRELIRDGESQRLRDENSRLSQELLIARLGGGGVTDPALRTS